MIQQIYRWLVYSNMFNIKLNNIIFWSKQDGEKQATSWCQNRNNVRFQEKMVALLGLQKKMVHPKESKEGKEKHLFFF